MISSIEITRFRGIREGKLEDLTPLVVLVGPNASGKSTVLDAVLIGAAPVIGDAIGRAVVRHQGVKRGVRWLLWRSGQHGQSEIGVTTKRGCRRDCRLFLEETQPTSIHFEARLQGVEGPSSLNGAAQILDPLRYSFTQGRLVLEDTPQARIVESPVEPAQTPLYELLTRCIERGQRSEAKEIVAELIPGVKDILILTEADAPIVHLEYADHSVPAALAGDGIHSLLRISLELLSCPNGVVLFEEPEVHQHPGAIRQSMRAVLAAVRRDIQVILTTHSLELIDLLLAESSEDDLKKLSLYRLQLEDGLLRSHRMAGSEVQFARTQIENDLR